MERKDRKVYIVDATRTPFIKVKKRSTLSASDLAVQAANHLIARQPIQASDLDQVIAGCVIPAANEANIARLIALRIACGDQTPAYTVQRNCASGLQAVDSAYQSIASGDADMVLAIGTESMSRAPFVASSQHAKWLFDLASKKSILAKLVHLSQARLSWLLPTLSLLQGLRDPLVHLTMGQTAELIAERFNITRDQADFFAYQSHQKASHAQKYAGQERINFYHNNQWYQNDDGLRIDTDLAQLRQLKPSFERFGQVTAGNSSQISDGAATVLLASEDAIRRFGLQPLATVGPSYWQGLDPRQMGLGPAFSLAKLVKEEKLTWDEIDLFEINEAFSAQVLACREALADDLFCCDELNLHAALGSIPMEKLNVEGGALALGHPIGASGARLVGHMAHLIKKKKAKTGVVSLCIGGGQGGAVCLRQWQG